MKFDVCIVGGCGHVGLPLAITFAGAGLKTLIIDKNEKALKDVLQGIMPFREKDASQKLMKALKNNLLFGSTDNSKASNAKNIIIIIGTPIDEFLNPRVQDIQKVFESLLPYFKPGQTIILRSTIYPGTTRAMHRLLLKYNKKVNLGFCPERVAEGQAIEEFKRLPQIISGIDKRSEKSAAALFSKIADEIIVTSPEEAELAKLMTNAWRYIQFAVANQFYTIADSAGLDFYKILRAIKFKYPRAKDFPEAGFTAGPCLFKDTMQIAAFNNNQFYLGHAAMLINEGLPNYIATQLKKKFDLSKKSVSIIGMAFKSDSDDKRDSLSYKLKKILRIEAKEVYCTDVYIKDPDFVSLKEALKADIIILGTPHKEYKNLKFRNNQHIVDIWNFWGPHPPSR